MFKRRKTEEEENKMTHISREVKHAINDAGSRSSEVSEADVDAAPVSLLQVKTSGI